MNPVASGETLVSTDVEHRYEHRWTQDSIGVSEQCIGVSTDGSTDMNIGEYRCEHKCEYRWEHKCEFCCEHRWEYRRV